VVLGEKILCYSLLENLIRNAIEASAKGDKITVMLERGEMYAIHIHNPSAIPKTIQPRFFQKFATEGKIQGTGLGAYSAMLAAKIQKGSITFRTSDEDGTTISVHLPKPE